MEVFAEELEKLLIQSPTMGVAVIVEALENASSYFDNACDPHTEAELDEVVQKIKETKLGQGSSTW